MPAFSKENSRIKMVALTKHGFENVTWYSFEKDNKKRSELIVDSMLRRFKASASYVVTNVIMFYEAGSLIHVARK